MPQIQIENAYKLTVRYVEDFATAEPGSEAAKRRLEQAVEKAREAVMLLVRDDLFCFPWML